MSDYAEAYYIMERTYLNMQAGCLPDEALQAAIDNRLHDTTDDYRATLYALLWEAWAGAPHQLTFNMVKDCMEQADG